jgi:hypothetical protein
MDIFTFNFSFNSNSNGSIGLEHLLVQYYTVYSLFKSERLTTNIKQTLHKALMRSIMTYACPAWDIAADNHLLKSQRPQNEILRTIGKFARRTPIRDLHTSFELPCMYDYITELFKQEKEVIQNHGIANAHNTGQGEPRHRKYKRLNLGSGQEYDCSSG